MKAETLLETPARAQMRKRDPGVLLVPDNRWDGAGDDRPQTGSRTEQSACKIEQEQTCARSEYRTKKAHTKFVCAENRSAGAYDKSDSWPFAEVGWRQALRPHPVVRLVEFEIGCRQHRQSNRR